MAAVLDVLAPMPVWVRVPVRARLTRALDDGYGPAALVRAVEEHFDHEASGEGRHLAELERTLGYLRGDVLAGGCATCGQNPHDDFGREVCLTCHPERTDEVDPAALQRVLASLQSPPTALAVRQ